MNITIFNFAIEKYLISLAYLVYVLLSQLVWIYIYTTALLQFCYLAEVTFLKDFCTMIRDLRANISEKKYLLYYVIYNI